MSDAIELIIFAGSLAFLIVAMIGLVACIWWFAGYICISMKWFDIDPNAQIVTTIVMISSLGILGGSRK